MKIITYSFAIFIIFSLLIALLLSPDHLPALLIKAANHKKIICEKIIEHENIADDFYTAEYIENCAKFLKKNNNKESNQK